MCVLFTTYPSIICASHCGWPGACTLQKLQCILYSMHACTYFVHFPSGAEVGLVGTVGTWDSDSLGFNALNSIPHPHPLQRQSGILFRSFSVSTWGHFSLFVEIGDIVCDMSKIDSIRRNRQFRNRFQIQTVKWPDSEMVKRNMV